MAPSPHDDVGSILADMALDQDAASLPTAAYDSVSFHLAEVEAIFRRAWVCVGHIAMLAKVGDYFTVDLVGELLVVVRAADRIRAMSRVCLHRWASLVEGAGAARRFTCPFHAWSYALDGRLIAAGHMERTEGFDRSRLRLPEIAIAVSDASGLMFVQLSGGPAAGAPDTPAQASLAMARSSCPIVETRVAGNWKRVVEDALQGDPGLYVMLPNLLISPTDRGAGLRLLFPDGPETTLVRTVTLIPPAGAAIAGRSTTPRLADYLTQRLSPLG